MQHKWQHTRQGPSRSMQHLHKNGCQLQCLDHVTHIDRVCAKDCHARVCFDSCSPSSLCKDCVLERLLASNYFQPLKSLWLRVLGQNPLPSRALRLQDRLPRACPHLLGDPLSKNYLRGHIIVRHYQLMFCNRTSIDNTSKTSRTSSN